MHSRCMRVFAERACQHNSQIAITSWYQIHYSIRVSPLTQQVSRSLIETSTISLNYNWNRNWYFNAKCYFSIVVWHNLTFKWFCSFNLCEKIDLHAWSFNILWKLRLQNWNWVKFKLDEICFFLRIELKSLLSFTTKILRAVVDTKCNAI